MLPELRFAAIWRHLGYPHGCNGVYAFDGPNIASQGALPEAELSSALEGLGRTSCMTRTLMRFPNFKIWIAHGDCSEVA